MNTQTTLKKISKVLNISISTVSRALKNHPDIAEKTKQKVKELAEILEYEPNTYAIQLRTNNSNVFGLIVPFISNYFYDSFIAAVEEECRINGYSIMILQSGDDAATEISNLRLCKQNRVSGIFACITPNTEDISTFLKIDAAGIPVIFFDKVPAFEACNKVCLADNSAAKIAAEKIIAKKKKKILALFGNKNLSITKKRLAAFKETFTTKNYKSQIIIQHVENAKETAEVCFKALSSNAKHDTIFCMSDEILTGAMKAIQQIHLQIPKDIAVISISNGIIPKLYYPEITYAETSGYKLGKVAFTRMLACLAGRTFVQEIVIDSMLVEGGSI